MKKENDEITDLFRTRLADAGMSVRDGFWEELSQEIPVACQHRRRILLFRVAAAASVLLVFGGLVGYFLVFLSQEEMEEAFTKIAVTNGGQMDGDGITAWQQQTTGIMQNRCCRNRPLGDKVLRHAVTIHGGRRFAFITFSMSFFFCQWAFWDRKWQPIW